MSIILSLSKLLGAKIKDVLCSTLIVVIPVNFVLDLTLTVIGQEIRLANVALILLQAPAKL
jgi:hypothetical protein